MNKIIIQFFCQFILKYTQKVKNYWLKSGFLSLLEKGSGLVFGLGTAILLLRGLSKPEFAAWGFFTLLTYFVDMGRSGLLQNSLMKYISTAENEENYRKISTASLFLNVILSAVLALVLWLSTDWMADFYKFPSLRTIVPIYLIGLALTTFSTHQMFISQANLQFGGIFWATFCNRGALFFWTLFAFFFYDKQLKINELARAMVIGAALSVLVQLPFSKQFLRFGALDFDWVKKLANYGKWILGTNLSTQFYKNADKMVLGRMLGPEAYAVYDAAGKITQMVEVPSFSIAAVVFPQSARRMAEDGPAGIKWLYEKSVGATLALIFPAVVGTLIFAVPIVRIFAGEGYESAEGILRLTAFFGLFMPYAVQFGTILDSTGRPATNFGYTFFTAVINLILSIFLIKYFNLWGAALATLIGYFISFLLMQRRLKLDFEINWLAPIGYAFDFYRGFYSKFLKILMKK
jgi:lipopolysaccharide exporter